MKATVVKLSGVEFVDSGARDGGVTILVFTNAIKVVASSESSEHANKAFIVSDDDELEIALIASRLNEFSKCLCESSNIAPIEVGGGFIKSKDSATETKTFS